MTDYNVKVPGHMVSSLMSDKGGLGSLLEVMLNQILEAQVSEQIGTERYERSDDRGAYRNGSRPRQLVTRVGPITLRIPQLRDGVFFHRDLPAIPAIGAGACFGYDGDGGERGFDP